VFRHSSRWLETERLRRAHARQHAIQNGVWNNRFLAKGNWAIIMDYWADTGRFPRGLRFKTSRFDRC
jgi:hypothetical protein